MSTAASLRQELSELADVTRAWFEWEFEDGHWVKTLVVEVTFDTDPASPEFKRSTQVVASWRECIAYAYKPERLV